MSGLRELVAALQSTRDRMIAVLVPKFGDSFDGDFDVMLEAINALKRALVTPPVAAPVVDDAMVRRAMVHQYGAGYASSFDSSADFEFAKLRMNVFLNAVITAGPRP